MNDNKMIRYSIQLSMLKQLLLKKLINEKEYQQIKKKLNKEYGVVQMFLCINTLDSIGKEI